MFTFINNKIFHLFNNIFIVCFIAFYPIKQIPALSHDWVGVPSSAHGEQFWDRKSIQINKDGSVRLLSKFTPKNQTEITKDIFYTMDINCFERSFRDVEVKTNDLNEFRNNYADWQDPNGDKLILGVINSVCKFDN